MGDSLEENFVLDDRHVIPVEKVSGKKRNWREAVQDLSEASPAEQQALLEEAGIQVHQNCFSEALNVSDFPTPSLLLVSSRSKVIELEQNLPQQDMLVDLFAGYVHPPKRSPPFYLL